ncbi:LysR family transcriptional regulator [Xanthovirga aplysinae]|uniref:LysR family transcriptional regulator n=1 Tax=Xanthovirga aplysinae TaxID=2529853 RepID=UPI0012BD3C1B|nr:LysR family transcriptional regulator [Xanthovirga aplysinae]MTI30736.1 LysR family transcriptional regulator [Xanthovirga aplysinae]
MINLEWFRTFRMVFIKKSVTKAAEELMVSQPAVSQQIHSLEAHLGKKLFTRKSKGVEATDYGKMLNNLIATHLEGLLVAEDLVVQKKSKLKSILRIGISEHLYNTILADRLTELGEVVYVTFSDRESLISMVEEGKLTAAIITQEITHFDVTCHVLQEQHFVLAGTPDIDFIALQRLFKEDKVKAEKWLSPQVWFSHDMRGSFIKKYWLITFDKKRPSFIPNYVIPNEFEVLKQQAKASGLSVTLDSTLKPFLERNELVSCELDKLPYRKISLITHKRVDREVEDLLLHVLKQ